MPRTPWAILGVPQDAGEAEVKQAYRKLVKEHHPDAGGDAERFKEITEAYETLTAKPDEPHLEAAEHGGFGDFSNHDDVMEFLRRQFQQRTRHSGAFNFTSFDEFNNFNPPLHLTYGIPFRDMVPGRTVSLRIGDRAVNFEIPPDCHHRQRIMVRGAGPDSKDVIVRLDVRVPPGYAVDGTDLHFEQAVDGITASIGGDFTYEHLDERAFRIAVPPATQEGSTIRMPGLGLAAQGDLFITFRIRNQDLSKHRDAIERILK